MVATLAVEAISRVEGPMVQGSQVRFSVLFKSTVSPIGPIDPTDVILRVRDPAGTVTAYDYLSAQVVKDSVGAYHCDVTCALAGSYFGRWEGSGTAVAVAEEGPIVMAVSAVL